MTIDAARRRKQRKPLGGWIRQFAGHGWSCVAQPARPGSAPHASTGGCEFDYDYYVDLTRRSRFSRPAIQEVG